MSWRIATLRNNRVYAHCDATGAFIVENGRVEIRYRPDDGRAYHASVRNLIAQENEPVLPEDTCVAVQQRIASKRVKKKSPKPIAVRPTDSIDRGPEVVAYTDGACTKNPGPAGMGVVLNDGNCQRELFGYLGSATNNIAELSAIKEALTAIDEQSRPVRIYTDSRYAIGVLTMRWKVKANWTLIEEIKSMLAKFSDIELIYVPGHTGNALNERADELARRAIRERASSGWIEIEKAL